MGCLCFQCVAMCTNGIMWHLGITLNDGLYVVHSILQKTTMCVQIKSDVIATYIHTWILSNQRTSWATTCRAQGQWIRTFCWELVLSSECQIKLKKLIHCDEWFTIIIWYKYLYCLSMCFHACIVYECACVHVCVYLHVCTHVYCVLHN